MPGSLTDAPSGQPLGSRRAEVLDRLRAARGPLGVLDLAAATGLHPNTARFHLDGLVDDETVSGWADDPEERRANRFAGRILLGPGADEFAYEAAERAGKRAIDAALEAARLRLRPILMTSLAFIFGVMPLVFSTGAGAKSRQAIGTAVMGGMIAATVLAIFFVPIFFVIVRGLFRSRAETVPATQAA